MPEGAIFVVGSGKECECEQSENHGRDTIYRRECAPHTQTHMHGNDKDLGDQRMYFSNESSGHTDTDDDDDAG